MQWRNQTPLLGDARRHVLFASRGENTTNQSIGSLNSFPDFISTDRERERGKDQWSFSLVRLAGFFF